MYWLSTLLILGDIYLWSAFRKKVFGYNIYVRVLIIGLYWLSLFSVFFIFVGSAIVPIINWNDVFRTYLYGFVFSIYTAKLLPILFYLVADAASFINKTFHLSNKQKRQIILKEQDGITRSRFLQYLGFLSGGMVLSSMFVGMFKWEYEYRVIREKIRIPGLPDGFKNLKIVHISDFHLGNWGLMKPMEEAIRMIMDLKPDMVVFTGDIVTFSTKETERFGDLLGKIKAPMGVYTVLGNHDYGLYVSWPDKEAEEKNMADLYDYYRRIGWKLLNNENVILEKGEDKLAIVGVENWGKGKRFPKFGDIDKALKGTEDVPVKILLSHDPSHWDYVVIPEKYPVALTLSGHTHGFQFGIETPKVKWSPAKYVFKHWAGLYKDSETGHYLYVNRGIGSIGYPGRIGILPEITVLELV
jgi:predicted MPP superfamily phosphohydrolase